MTAIKITSAERTWAMGSPTPVIQHAIRHGCHYVTGREMHAGQVDALMAFFAPKQVSPKPPVTSH